MIFDFEDSLKGPHHVNKDRIIKHIDWRKDSLFIIYYDKPYDQIPADTDEIYLKMNCLVLYDIQDLL
jgi:hypothetical protein